MNGLEFYKLTYQSSPVVKFNNHIEEFEIGFESGMMARLVGWKRVGEDFEGVFDFSEFEEHNKSYEQPNYYDKNGVACLKWSETAYYPKDKREEMYFCATEEVIGLDIIEENKAYADYINSNPTMTYVKWLEEQYLKSN